MLGKEENKKLEILVRTYSSEKEIGHLKDELIKILNTKNKIPVLIQWVPIGTLRAPDNGHPFFRFDMLLPAELFKEFDKEEFNKGGPGIGLDALDKLVMYLFILFPKDQIDDRWLKKIED